MVFKSSSKISQTLALGFALTLSQISCSDATEPYTSVKKDAASANSGKKPTKVEEPADDSEASKDAPSKDTKGSVPDKMQTPGEADEVLEPSPAPNPVPAPVPTPDKPAVLPCSGETAECHPHRFIVVDEPKRKMGYVNLDDPSKDWDLNLPNGGRDIQLIGKGKVMVGTLDGNGGYYEVDIVTGKITKSVMNFGGVMSVQRLKNGNTLIMGGGLAGGRGTVVIEVKEDRSIVKKYEFPNASGGRLIRRTKAGTFLIGSSQGGSPDNDIMLEYTAEGKELLRLDAKGVSAHMGLRLPNGDTVVANGHGAAVLIYDKTKKLKVTLGGKDQPGKDPVHFNYGGQFQVLNNGHFVLTNWQGHGTDSGASGRQLVEYDANGVQVWSWKQDAQRFSSIHGVLVLDNLDTNVLYDDTNGALAPAE